MAQLMRERDEMAARLTQTEKARQEALAQIQEYENQGGTGQDSGRESDTQRPEWASDPYLAPVAQVFEGMHAEIQELRAGHTSLSAAQGDLELDRELARLQSKPGFDRDKVLRQSAERRIPIEDAYYELRGREREAEEQLAKEPAPPPSGVAAPPAAPPEPPQSLDDAEKQVLKEIGIEP